MNRQILKWIRIVVMRTLKEKGLKQLDVSSLLSAGMLGYAQCLKRFEPERKIKFKTYAEHRIKGAVLDEVRKMIGDERCKNPRPRRVDYDLSTQSDNWEAQRIIDSDIDLKKFYEYIPLDEREMGILKCRVDGMSLREIAKAFSFSESRASQILAKIKKTIYVYYRSDLGSDFSLVVRSCPLCHNESYVSEAAIKFLCDICDAALVVECLDPIKIITEAQG